MAAGLRNEGASSVVEVTLSATGNAGTEGRTALESAHPWGLPIPQSFDGYFLIRSIGRGGMGEVFLAQDTVLDRPVAIKFIAATDAGVVATERFRREARAIARIQHPNVVTVYRAGELEGIPYLVSEFVTGNSLDRVSLPLPGGELIRICTGLAAGLSEAHRRGVLHRDIKPGNALVSDSGEVKLCDFGLAKLFESSPESISALACGNPELTHQGSILGTPRYMAPEIWLAEPATVRSDLYSLGAMFFKLAAGQAPVTASSLDEIRLSALSGSPPSLAKLAPAVDPRFCDIVDRCLQREPNQRPASADEVHAQLCLIATPAQRVNWGNPYRGLRPFDTDHRSLFFGRKSESLALLDTMRESSMAIVAGDSGVGKSSLCRAGVLPLVSEGGLGDQRHWSAVRILPGRHPLSALARGLARHMDDRAGVEESLLDDPRTTARDLGMCLGDRRGLLIFIDQLEELVTESIEEEHDAAAIAISVLGSGIPGVRVLATARGDFLTRLSALPGLGRVLARSLFLLGPLELAQIREAIIGPARQLGVSFESEELVGALAATVKSTPGALPLLQFALSELWERRDGVRSLITQAALANIGGASGALARHADGVLTSMSPAEKHQARNILTQLVTIDGTRATRREAELISSDETALATLQTLVRGRLLVAQRGEDGQSTYGLAHETLVTHWATLRGWLDRDERRREVHQRLAAAAAEWDRLARPVAILWTAPQLAEAGRAELNESHLGGRELEFFRESSMEHRRRALRRRGLVFSVPVVIVLVWFGLYLKEVHDRGTAIAAQLASAGGDIGVARASTFMTLSMRALSFDAYDRGDSRKGESLWSAAEHIYEIADAEYQRASMPLETALQLDRENLPAHASLEVILFNRAHLARTFHDDRRMGEQLTRLAWLDESGEMMKRWRAPAHLRVMSTPSAEITIETYDETMPRWPLVRPRTLGKTPLQVDLGPGSYRLTIRHTDRPDLLYPIALDGGESLSVDLNIPRRDQIPAGYVYVPRGRFRFGSADPDDVRLPNLLAEPERQVELPEFLIGRHEVTFEDWIAFLDSLSPMEKQKRRPMADGVELKLGKPGEEQLVIRPSSFVYAATRSQPIVYRDRHQRRIQNWLHFPVSGVSSADAEAYMAWLNESGQLPGARLCTDQEWERAARGADARRYPHGNELHPDDANYDQTYGQLPGGFGYDEVGSHSESDSPFGVSDLAGNVWEYVRSAKHPGAVLIRGGSFYQDAVTQESINHESTEPGLRSRRVGIRVCSDITARRQ